MYSRIINKPINKSFFLFGPRGTGKTTWVRSTFPQGLIIDLLDSGLYYSLLASPRRLENLIPPDFNDWIVIDEIQRIPDLLNEVHRLIENLNCKFVLTGSSARKLRKKGVNLLAGRAVTRYMHPLTAYELGDDYSLGHSLSFGQLPSAYMESDPADYLESYIHTYLREEILQEGLTRNLQAFARFLLEVDFILYGEKGIHAIEVKRARTIRRRELSGLKAFLKDYPMARGYPVLWGGQKNVSRWNRTDSSFRGDKNIADAVE
jgi:predicted AAA+ superfamily ATPase